MGKGIASVVGARCGSRCLRREARGVSRERKFPGFTLIELLVVIAIFSIFGGNAACCVVASQGKGPVSSG